MDYNGTVSIMGAAISLRPNGGCSLTGEDAADLEWDEGTILSDVGIPTVAEVLAEQERLQLIADSNAYARNRKEEYDQLNQFEMQFDDHRDSTTTWTDAINEIKSRHPKPE